MGASQSSGGGETPGGSSEVKTSYYELLGVERTATQDELKKAYRKKALELHPDRNYGDVERTTALFAEVRSAYEVLSDDQERAWYDAHEGDILRGGSGEGATEEHYQGSMKVTAAEDLVRMMGRFRGNIDFSDAPSGFYGFVRDTFAQLAREEEYAADYDGLSIPEYPTFGHKDDDYDDVVRSFYSAWNGFATVKSFAWMDVYRLSDAPDRRTRRLAEKENQKFRDDGRRDFNDAVRTLVAFVRKRDPRYTPNKQSDEDKAKAQRDARKAQAARSRAAYMAKLEQEAQALPNWVTDRPGDEEEQESEEEVEEEHFECVACNKTFKSERQYEAHEKSKKHQKAIQSLKRKMQKDNAHLNLNEDAISSGVITPADDSLDIEASESDANGLDESSHDLARKTDELKIADDDKTDSEVEGEQEKATNIQRTTTSTTNAKHDTDDDNDNDNDNDNASESTDDEYAPRSTIQARLASASTTTPPPPTTLTAHSNLATDPPSIPTVTEPKLGKAAQKRLKKAAKQADETAETDTTHKCSGCDASFPSRTRLFEHLKEQRRHAILKRVAAGGRGGGGGGGGGAGGKKKGKR